MRFLKRFPESKHEQILQIMTYIQMCGLSGRDLVSIGGWIDRQKISTEYRANKERIQGFIDQKTIRPIGRDHPDQMANRFKYRGTNGDYNFRYTGWSRKWDVTSMSTKITKSSPAISVRQWPSRLHWHTREFYDCVLDIADDSSWLNF